MVDVRFSWVDVFADEPLTGNSLALVPDADGLTVDQMLAITKEFNQSETTFLLKPADERADHRLRSFTTGGVEVLGAGHNAMGAWIWLAAGGHLDAARSDFVQQIGDELLPVRVERDPGGAVRISMTQSPPRFLAEVRDRAALAGALGLDAEDVAERPAQVASTGAEHLLVALRNRSAVDRAAPNPSTLRRLLAASGAEGCYVYAVEPGEHDTAHAYARFFNPTVGIAEDPATGTAAGPLAALLRRDDAVPEGRPVIILQGAAMGRPSILEVSVDGERVELSGSGLVVAEGVLHL